MSEPHVAFAATADAAQRAAGVIAARHRGDFAGAESLLTGLDDESRAAGSLFLADLAVALFAQADGRDIGDVAGELSLHIAEPARYRAHHHLWALFDGTPSHAPPGRLTYDAHGRVACHLCGRRFEHLGPHLRAHGWTAARYRVAVGIGPTDSLTAIPAGALQRPTRHWEVRCPRPRRAGTR